MAFAKEFVLRERAVVRAPIVRCFALSTRLELVQKELGFEGSPSTGHVELGGHVLWTGWMFGLKHEHLTAIPEWNPPFYFRDEMERGRFASFHHDHHFAEVDGGTEMQDELHFAMPLGVAGAAVGRWMMAPKIAELMRRRFALLKGLAEGEGWREFVDLEKFPGAA